MENSNLLLIYLATLLALLGVAAFFVLRQVFKTRRIESTLSRLQTKLTKEKGTAKEYYELGSLLLDKKLYTQSAMYLQQAIKQLGKDETENAALIYNALGYTYFAQDQYDMAIRNYKEALKIAPGYVTALNNLGHSYEKKQLDTQALEMYETALKLEPKNTTPNAALNRSKSGLWPSKNRCLVADAASGAIARSRPAASAALLPSQLALDRAAQVQRSTLQPSCWGFRLA